MTDAANPTTTDALQNLSNELANAVETAAISIVRVEARRGNASSGVIWSSDGHILTADHTVEKEEDIAIGHHDGRSLRAKLVARDPGSDLALLKVDATDLQPAQRATSSDVRVGNLALSIGRPGESGPMASLGIVSAIGGAWRTARGSQLESYVRTDATLYPGFSGGPLVDVAGRVIGINSWTLSQGAGLAIPIDLAAQTAQALTQGGVKRAYLGVATQPVSLPAAIRSKAGTNQEAGLMLVSVEPDGPAEKGGLLIGDILLSIDGKPLHTAEDLLGQLGGGRAGQAAAFKVVRGGEVHDRQVTLGQRS